MDQKQLTRYDLEAKIIQHSCEDEEFRKEFLADAAGAFSKHLQIPPSSLPKIVVHEEGPGSWHIVLPPKPANTAELSSEELEKVAGGASPTIVIASLIASPTTAVVASTALDISIYVTIVEKGW
jgi:hypothetical protein